MFRQELYEEVVHLNGNDSPQTYNLQLHISNTPSSFNRYRMEIYDMSSNVMVYETSQGATTPSGIYVSK